MFGPGAKLTGTDVVGDGTGTYSVLYSCGVLVCTVVTVL